MDPPDTIFRLLDQDAWQRALTAGAFLGTEHDRRDGFIHFSTAEQVVETARRHYAGRADLLLLWVSRAALGAALRWEPSRGGDLFPHLYGPLPTSAVVKTAPLPLGADGRHTFPDGVGAATPGASSA